MSLQRRSSSPLSSATPSPLQAPRETDKAVEPPALKLGTPTAASDDDDGDIIGGSSPTTLTEPLTESELTEDDDEIEEDRAVVLPAHDGHGAREAATVDASADGDDDYENDEARLNPRGGRLSLDGSSLSPSPSLTPPPPSDPPRSDALPSSPHAHNDAGDIDEQLQPNNNDDGDEPDRGDTRAPPDDDDVAEDEASGLPGAIASAMDDNANADDVEDEDGDVTMRAEAHLPEDVEDDSASNMDGESKQQPEAPVDDVEIDDHDPISAAADIATEEPQEEPEEDEEAEADDAEAVEAGVSAPSKSSHHHSSHAPPPTSAAVRALFALEVKFAALRDRLYVERLEESAREEEMVLNGTHPALLQLNKTLGTRRERLHEVASRRFQEQLNDLGTWRNVEEKISWQTWTDQRDQLQWEEFEHTWSKRRRLAREKNELETPKVHRPVPRVDKQPRPFDWSAGAVPAKLSADDALRDLQLMEARRQQQQQQQAQHHQQSRNASPMYTAFSGGPSNAVYPYQSQHPAHYLNTDPSYGERRQDTQPLPQHQTLPVSSAVASQDAGQPRISGAGPFAQQQRQQKMDYASQPRRDVGSLTNGDRRSNGHVRPPQSVASGPSGTAPSMMTTGGSNAPTPGDSKRAGQTTGASSGTAQADRPSLSSRFQGFSDYLSGGGASPHHSFQHQLGVPKGASGSASGNKPGSSHSSALGRAAFSQTPQPQAAGAQRS